MGSVFGQFGTWVPLISGETGRVKKLVAVQNSFVHFHKCRVKKHTIWNIEVFLFELVKMFKQGVGPILG